MISASGLMLVYQLFQISLGVVDYEEPVGPLSTKSVQHDLPAAILLAQQVLLGNPGIVKKHLAEGRDTGRLLYLAETYSRRFEVDEENAEERRKAEIALEVGQRGGNGSDLRVFAGRNVMFVGTMNEDESTQMISDKVVDRANVLRFGRPKRLQDRL